MEVFVNDTFLKRRKRMASWATYIAVGALVLGLIMSSRQLLISYALLLVGMLGATIGSQLTATYVREPRSDAILSDALSRLDKRYALYCYYLPSHHVLVSHHGFTVLTPRAQKGEIAYDDGKWRHKAGARKLLQLFGEPALGHPDADTQQEMDWVAEWAEDLSPEIDIPVTGIVVFTNPDVTLHVDDAPVPAVKAADLADGVQEHLKGQPTLTTAHQKEIRRKLDDLVQADA